MNRPTRRALTTAALSSLVVPVAAQSTAPRGGLTQASLLTIFLRHDESKTLAQIDAEVKQSGFFRRFPPRGIEVVSWYVMMGIGQVVTLKKKNVGQWTRETVGNLDYLA